MYVGADWDTQKCVVVFEEKGKLRRANVERHPEAVRAFMARIGSDETVEVGIEPGDGAWVSLWSSAGAKVHVFDGKKAKHYGNSFHSSGASDDRRSAEVLLSMVKSPEHRAHENAVPPAEMRALSRLLDLASQLSQDVVRDTNRLFSHLSQVHPAVALIAGRSKSSRWLLRALEGAPTAAAWNELNEEQRNTLLKGSSKAKRAQFARAFGDDWKVVDTEEELAVRLHVRVLASRLAASIQAHREVEAQLKKLQRQTDDTTPAVPGIGPFLSSAITIGLWHEPGRDDLALALGAAPVTSRSGTMGDRHPTVRLRRAVSPTMRKAGHLLGFQLVGSFNVARAQYAFYRSRGCDANGAYRRIARSFSRVLFALHRDKAEFDEQRYIDALKQKGVIWALDL